MHALVMISSFLAYGSILLYAPLAKTWKRAILVPVVVFLLAMIVSEFAITASHEDMPPVVGFVLAPIVAALSAMIARVVGGVVFEIPLFKQIKEKIEKKWGR